MTLEGFGLTKTQAEMLSKCYFDLPTSITTTVVVTRADTKSILASVAAHLRKLTGHDRLV